MGSDFKDLEPLTPEHFLDTGDSLALGLSELDEVRSQSFRKSIQCFREMMLHVVKRFQRETGLQPRSKWKKQMHNLTIGSVVTVFDPTSPKYWPLAIITGVKKRKDECGLM